MVPGDESDVGILPVSEFGVWADRAELTPVPAALRAAEHPFQWSGLLPAYREQLIEWGGQARAIPLAGDGFVIVYRADRLTNPKFIDAFRKRDHRNPTAPTTWEEFAVLAGTFAELDGKPSLPPLAGPDLTTLFFRVATCHDRLAMNDAAIARRGGGLELLAFQFDLGTGEPRLTTPGFSAAANWIAGLAAKKCLPPSATTPGDPVAALAEGRAMLAVLSLAEVARLPRENGMVPVRFGLAAMPGTTTYVDPEKGQLISATAPNYLPYFAGGRLGVVRTRCPKPDAAFDLLAELGGPTRSLEVVANPGLGAGPFRTSHLDRDRIQIWLGYGFDVDRSNLLQETMRLYVRQEVKNPTHGLRGPDQAPLTSAATDELVKIAAGSIAADVGLQQLTARWKQIDEKTPKEVRLRWRKLAAGLN